MKEQKPENLKRRGFLLAAGGERQGGGEQEQKRTGLHEWFPAPGIAGALINGRPTPIWRGVPAHGAAPPAGTCQPPPAARYSATPAACWSFSNCLCGVSCRYAHRG